MRGLSVLSTQSLKGEANRTGDEGALRVEIVPAAYVNLERQNPQAETGSTGERGLGILDVLQGAQPQGDRFGEQRLLGAKAEHLAFEVRYERWIRSEIGVEGDCERRVGIQPEAGAYFKGHWGDQAFGVNVSDVATGGLFAADPLTATISGSNLAVNGSLRANALEARQINFSYAYAFADRTFSLGLTSKIIQGAAYASDVAVFDATSGHFEIRSDLGQAKISTQFGVDAGAVFQPASWFRLGIVAKDINEPTFDAPDGSEFKLVPQVRAGLGLNPYESLTIAFDADLTSNPTLVPNVKSQVLSLGAEQTLLSKTIALRLGVLKNVKDAQSSLTGTAGLGLRVLALQIDLGGGYDFNTQGTLIAGSVGLTF